MRGFLVEAEILGSGAPIKITFKLTQVLTSSFLVVLGIFKKYIIMLILRSKFNRFFSFSLFVFAFNIIVEKIIISLVYLSSAYSSSTPTSRLSHLEGNKNKREKFDISF